MNTTYAHNDHRKGCYCTECDEYFSNLDNFPAVKTYEASPQAELDRIACEQADIARYEEDLKAEAAA